MSANTNRRSWLEGPQVPGAKDDPSAPSKYAGEALGLPKDGPGSLSTLMPRLIALVIDWFISLGLAWFIVSFTSVLGGKSTVTMLVFILLRILGYWLFARTPGHAIVGIGVARLDRPNERVGLWRAVVRTVLTVFLFPPVIQDTDGRGMHDRVTQTGVIRTR